MLSVCSIEEQHRMGGAFIIRGAPILLLLLLLQEIFIVHCIGWKTLLSCQYIKRKYFQLYDSNNYVRPVML